MKTQTLDLDSSVKAFAIVADNCALKRDPVYKRDVHMRSVQGSPLFQFGQENIRAEYSAAHVLSLSPVPPGKIQPQNVRLVESDVRLVALSLTCSEISAMMKEALVKGNDPVLERLREASPDKQALVKEPLIFKSGYKSHFAEARSAQEIVSPEQLSRHASLSDIPKGAQVCRVSDETLDNLTIVMHMRMLAMEGAAPGLMADNSEIVLAALFASQNAEKVQLPLPEYEPNSVFTILDAAIELDL